MRYTFYGDLGNSFQIFVDRIEGNFAICEFPDDSMKDIPISFFLDELIEQTKYQVRYDEKGNLEYLFRVLYLPCVIQSSSVPKSRLSSRLVRF